jgi:hypothetical protein
MLHRNENFCLLLFTRKFSDLLGIAVAKGLVIKTIGDISPGSKIVSREPCLNSACLCS